MTDAPRGPRDIADIYQQAADIVQSALDAYGEDMPAAERKRLVDAHGDLTFKSMEATTQAVAEAIAAAQADAATLSAIIAEAKAVTRDFKEVATAIRLAAAVVSLATGVAGRDPGAVAKAVNEIRELTDRSNPSDGATA